MATTDRRGVSVNATDTPIAGDPNPGLAIKAPVRVATTAAITLAGVQTIDGVALAAGDRVLVKNQVDQKTNGIYKVGLTAWTRAIDADGNDDYAGGQIVGVSQGASNTNAVFTLTTVDPITLGTSLLVYQNFQLASSRRLNATAPLLVNGGASATLQQDDTFSIAPNGINYALLQQVGANKILGNPTGALANVSEIGLGATLAFAATLLTTIAMSGDVATAANSFATTIQPNVVSYAKMQQVAASRILGNPTGSLANASEISLGATLAFSGTALQTAAITGDVAAGANSFVTTIQPAAVTLAKMANLTGLSVIGSTGASAATPVAVTGTTDQVLRISSAGTALGFGAINLAAAAAVSNTLGAANGGTGNNTYAIGDLIQASASTTLSRLAAVATGNVLLSGGVTTVSLWGKVGLTTHVSGILAEGNGGTNQATYTLGDTLYASAANALSKLAGNTTGTRKFLRQTGTGTVSAAPAWDTIVAADVPASALTTGTADANVIITLGGAPSTALLSAASITMSWTSTLSVPRGGIGQGTLTNHAVLVGAGTAAITQIAVPASGTLFQGVAAADPIWTATPTLGVGGATAGSLAFAGLTSGTTTLQSNATASGVLTLPAATDTLIGKATTDTLTNKTYDTAGTGNSFKINGTGITAVTGTGSVVLATSPTLVTPALGVATVTTINKVTLTPPATGSTLTIADGKTLTASNSLTFTGTDGQSFAFPAVSDTVGALGTAQTWTKQNIHTVALTIASGAGATLDDLKVAAATTTVTGTTTIATAAGFNKVGIYQPTYTDASVVTISTAATLYVDNAPAAAGSVTITNAWAINVGAGNVRFPGTGNLLGTITSGTWNGTKIGLAFGGTNVDLSATGGTSQVLKQTSVGGNITVAQLAASDLSNGTTGSGGGVVLATGATLSGAIHTGTTDIQQTFKLSGAITPTALAADVNDYNPTGLGTTCIIRQDGGAASRNITGLTAQGSGTMIVLENIGTSNNLVLNDQSVSSTAANRFLFGANITLTPNQSAIVWYDGTSSRWRCLGTFTTAGGGGGTVTSVATGDGLTGGAITTSGTIKVTALQTPGGRLTISTGVPVMTSTVTGATSHFYTPYAHRFVPINNGTNFVLTDIGASDLTQTTADTTKSPAAVAASSNYDCFVWSDAGTIRCTRGPAWTSATARGTGPGTTELQLLNGIWTNKNAITNGPGANLGTFVGSFRSNGSSTIDYQLPSAALNGGAGLLYVWNAYNRIGLSVECADTTGSWTQTTSTIGPLNASNTNRISILSGLAEDGISVSLCQRMALAPVVGAFSTCGLAMDGTTAHDRRALVQNTAAQTCNGTVTPSKSYLPQLGQHFFQALQSSDGTNTATFNGNTTDSALTLTWRI